LDGKVAIVTGGGQGVGEGIALALAGAGAATVVAGRTLAKVERVAKAIAEAGGTALAVRADVAERAAVDTMVAATVDAFGTVDILVNNAQSTGQQPLDEVTYDDVWTNFSTGPLASLYCMQACLPYLKRRGGTIINLGSTAALMANPTFGAYTIAKEGVRGLTKVAAREWGQYGITVNVICPMANSPASDDFLTRHPEHHDRLIREMPLGRIGDPSTDIGGACVALASSELGYLTGSTLILDGGRCVVR